MSAAAAAIRIAIRMGGLAVFFRVAASGRHSLGEQTLRVDVAKQAIDCRRRATAAHNLRVSDKRAKEKHGWIENRHW